MDAKKYRNIQVDPQCELLSAIGDISLKATMVRHLDVDVVLGLSDG